MNNIRQRPFDTDMTKFEVPTLPTERLRLRAFRPGDLDAYAAMQADPEVMRYLVTGRTSTRAEVWRTMATSLESWASRSYGIGACEKIDDSVFIGSVGSFQPLDWPEPEITYSLAQPFWRRGFVTGAASATRDWFFGHFPLQRAARFLRPDNHASKRLALRPGAVYAHTIELRGSASEHWVHFRRGQGA